MNINKLKNKIKTNNRELQLAVSKTNDEYLLYIYKDLANILNLISTQGDSGLSYSIKTQLLNKLMTGKNLTPLSLNEEEWITVSDNNKQSARVSSLFIIDNKIHYLEAITVKDNYMFLTEATEPLKRNDMKNRYTTCKYFVTSDRKIKEIKRFYKPTSEIENIDLYTDKDELDIFQLEYPKDWWLFFGDDKQRLTFKHWKSDVINEYTVDEFIKAQMVDYISFNPEIFKERVNKLIDFIINK